MTDPGRAVPCGRSAPRAGLVVDFDLERFVRAQDDGGTYEAAVAELRAGRKRSHWMWFVFPQVAGLGPARRRSTSRCPGWTRPGPTWPTRCWGRGWSSAARALTGLPGGDPVAVLGPVDALKLRSSMTLFARAAGGEPVFADVLAQYYGGAEDPATVSRI